MKALGIIGEAQSGSHDPAAALVIDGTVVAAIEEERLVRSKHAVGQFPRNAVDMCLAEAGCRLRDLDSIAIGWNSVVGAESRDSAIDRALPAGLREDFPSERISFVDHHVAHALSSWICSDGGPSVAVVCDGRGETTSSSAFRLHQSREPCRLFGRPIAESIGLFYEAAAGYCDLGFMSAGKLMGLSAYATAGQEFPGITEAVFSSHFDKARAADSAEEASALVYAAWLSYFAEHCYPYRRRSNPASVLPYSRFAAGAQRSFEDQVLFLVEEATRMGHGGENLCLSGGAFLNCRVNERICLAYSDRSVHIPSAAGDSGAAIGAALEATRQHCGASALSFDQQRADLGKRHPVTTSLSRLDPHGLTPENGPRALQLVVKDLCNNRIVLWFHGRDEFGPRALGNRSIIADPRTHATLVQLNRLKGREQWRPLAPILLESRYSTLFDSPFRQSMRHMLCTATVKENMRGEVPAIVHVDGSTRPQVLPDDSSNPLRRVLLQFEHATGCTCLVNTSLNTCGLPIVHDVDDVLKVLYQAPSGTSAFIDGLYVSLGGIA